MISAKHQKEVMQNRHQCFSAIARSVMISAIKNVMQNIGITRFSAIARSVMISAFVNVRADLTYQQFQCYSS